MTDDQGKVEALLEDSVYGHNEAAPSEIEDSQPKYASWASFDVDLGSYSIEQVTVLGYEDSESMHKNMVKLVSSVLTTEMLQFVRTGTIRNISFRIGPHTISSTDLNEQNGIDKLTFDKPYKKA
jgi:hypothetical protein